ncbi:MAG: KOW domain-containing RNA-binding protein [Eubacterium sp.]|nr:KOW domain-containing RNA-binding protein [Eubacterium sp.]
MDARTGDFAKSKSGHDKDEIYVVVGISEGFVYLCDGRLRPTEKPKKKNVKHIQPINRVPEDIKLLCLQNGKFYNEGIKKAIKDYKIMTKAQEE